jgi:hypothetical protein
MDDDKRYSLVRNKAIITNRQAELLDIVNTDAGKNLLSIDDSET